MLSLRLKLIYLKLDDISIFCLVALGVIWSLFSLPIPDETFTLNKTMYMATDIYMQYFLNFLFLVIILSNLMSFDQCHSFCAGSRIITKDTAHYRGLYLCTRFFNTSHCHTEMLRLNNSKHAFGFQCLHNCICYVCSKSFLYLQALCLNFNNPRKFADSSYPVPLWNVSNMRNTTKWK